MPGLHGPDPWVLLVIGAGRLVVAGLDLSLTSTGVALAQIDWVGSTSVTRPWATRVRSTGTAGASLADRWGRLDGLVQEVIERLYASTIPDLVVVEGPSYGQARQGGQHDRAGLWWLLMQELHLRHIPAVEVPPACRAKYATGRGNAAKDEVLAAVIRRYPGFEIAGNDVADAVILAAMGCRALGWPIESLPIPHLTAMEKVRWPGLVARGPAATPPTIT